MRFQVRTIGGRGEIRPVSWHDTEEAALAAAAEIDLHTVTQVSIEASIDGCGHSFAVRHLSWQPSDGEGHYDTLWHLFIDGHPLDNPDGTRGRHTNLDPLHQAEARHLAMVTV